MKITPQKSAPQEKSAPIIGVVNTKGGPGKSTIAINLACAFHHEGFDTAILDTDPNGTAQAWSARRSEDKITVMSITDPEALRVNAPKLRRKFDVLIVDGAPQLHEMMTSTIALADMLIIPVKPSPNDLWRIPELVKRVRDVQELRLNACGVAPLAYFVVNQIVRGTRLSTEIDEALQDCGLPIMETKINHRIVYADALVQGRSAVESSNKKAKEEMLSLLNEVKAKLGWPK